MIHEVRWDSTACVVFSVDEMYATQKAYSDSFKTITHIRVKYHIFVDTISVQDIWASVMVVLLHCVIPIAGLAGPGKWQCPQAKLEGHFNTSIVVGCCGISFAWWRQQMGTFSALLALCEANSSVTGDFPSQRPVTQSFDVSLICTWTNVWVNNLGAGDLRRRPYHAHYHLTIME